MSWIQRVSLLAALNRDGEISEALNCGYIFLTEADRNRFRKQADKGSPKTAYLIGYCHTYGMQGFESDADIGWHYLSLAASLDYAPALYVQGQLECKKQRFESALSYYHRAVLLGHATSMREIGTITLFRHIPTAALWYSKYVTAARGTARWRELDMLRRDFEYECTPYGIWEPNRTYHRLVAANIQKAVFTWLVVARRHGMCRDITLLICRYIVTRAAWGQRSYFTRKS